LKKIKSFSFIAAIFMLLAISGCEALYAQEEDKKRMLKVLEPYFKIIDEINQEYIDAGQMPPSITEPPDEYHIIKMLYDSWIELNLSDFEANFRAALLEAYPDGRVPIYTYDRTENDEHGDRVITAYHKNGDVVERRYDKLSGEMLSVKVLADKIFVTYEGDFMTHTVYCENGDIFERIYKKQNLEFLSEKRL